MESFGSTPSDSTNRFYRPELSEAGTWVTPIGELYDEQPIVEKQAVKPTLQFREMYRQESGRAYSAELGWAINFVEQLDADLDAAKDDDERQAVFAKVSIFFHGNEEKIIAARDYIDNKRRIMAAEEALLGAMKAATDALASGDKAAYLAAEALLQDTNPIDTQAIRDRIAADYEQSA